MTDEEMFKLACVQITLEGELDTDGNLTIGDELYECWPETLTVHGQKWSLSDTESETQLVGKTPETKSVKVRAFYDFDDFDDEESNCPECGEPLDKCCGTGEPRCPNCDGPCPYCDDGPGPGEDPSFCDMCGKPLDEDGFCPYDHD